MKKTTEAEPEMLRIRIKPHNPQSGHTLQRITVSSVNGKMYEEGKWYEEAAHTAAALEEVNMDSTSTRHKKPGVERAFDIMTEEEYEELQAEELRERTGLKRTVHVAPDRQSKDTVAKVKPARVGARRAAAQADAED